MATTFLETAKCPAGHEFKVRRYLRSKGKVVNTVCKTCGVQFDAPAGTVPERVVAEAKRGPTHERQIETYLVKRVGQVGGECRKVEWIGRKGAPDRLVMLPAQERMIPLTAPNPRGIRVPMRVAAQTIWVELKAPGKAATFPANPHERAQHREHERMRKMGQRVEVVDSYEQIEELLK